MPFIIYLKETTNIKKLITEKLFDGLVCTSLRQLFLPKS